jgi:PAS domain S-box-containing protein
VSIAPAELELLRSGKTVMDQIRSEAAGMRAREESLLKARAAVLADDSNRALALILVGNLIALLVLLLVFLLLRRENVRRQAAQLIAQKHAEEVEDLYNNAPCGYHSLDKNGLIVKMNDTELLWLGYTRDEVVGKMRLTDLLTPDSLAKFQQQFRVLKETGIVNDVDLDFVRNDGTILPVIRSASAQKDERGEFVFSRSTVSTTRSASAGRRRSESSTRRSAGAASSSRPRTRNWRRSVIRSRMIFASRFARWTGIRTCWRRTTATASTAKASACCGRFANPRSS